VAAMPTLEQLWIGACSFDDIEVLRTAPRLRMLTIQNAAPVHGPWSLASLSTVTTLRALYVSGSGVAYDSIGALVQLEEIRCVDAPDLSWMTNLVALRAVEVRALTVNHADEVLTLDRLGPYYAPVLEVVARMPQLTHLTLLGCTFPSLVGLAASPRLEQVDIFDAYLHRGGNLAPGDRPATSRGRADSRH